jgi:hypothetical protein
MNYLYLVFAVLFAALAIGSYIAKRKLEKKFFLTKWRLEMTKEHITDRELTFMRESDPSGAFLTGFVSFAYQVIELHFKCEVIGFVLACVAALMDIFVP